MSKRTRCDPHAPGPRGTHPPAVLVAVEDPAMRALIVEALALDGHDVATANDDDALLTAIREAEGDLQRAPHAVILDGRLAGAHGTDALARLRTRRGSLGLLVLAAPENYAGQAEAIRLGARVLTQPLDLAELRAATRSVSRGGS